MGIASASEIFTEALRVILEGLEGVINMIDDILVFGETSKTHHDNLMKVLERLERAGITLNLEKCEFYVTELTFFGLRFSADGVSPTIDRVKSLKEAKPPETVSELRSFLGAAQWCSRFIENMCTTTQPLWRLTKNDVLWTWGKTEQAAFDELKDSISTRCMAFFDKKWNTELVVDASPVGLSAILRQTSPRDSSNRKYVFFASRVLSDTETRYSQCEKEALAAVWGCERFWFYLIGKAFRLITDNRAVQLIFNNSAARPPARIERWALRLTQFDFIVEHQPGKSNIADYFSRQPLEESTDNDAENEARWHINYIVASAKPHAITRNEIIAETAADEELKSFVEWLRKPQQKRPLEPPKGLEYYARFKDEITVLEEGIILRDHRQSRFTKEWYSLHTSGTKA